MKQSKEKTHYRKAFHSPYLSAADIVDPVILTISHVRLNKDETKKTKNSFNTAYFVEHEIRKGEILKPMILNVSNSKMIKTLADSPFIDDWNNISIEIYVDKNVRFGRDTVEGLRIRKVPPAPPKLTKVDFQKKIDVLSDITAIEAWETAHLQKAQSALSETDYEWFNSYIVEIKDVFKNGE